LDDRVASVAGEALVWQAESKSEASSAAWSKCVIFGCVFMRFLSLLLVWFDYLSLYALTVVRFRSDGFAGVAVGLIKRRAQF
jgi:hypothetical protein